MEWDKNGGLGILMFPKAKMGGPGKKAPPLKVVTQKEGGDDSWRARQQPYHPRQSTPAQPVQQQSLHLVIGMMSHSYRLSMCHLAQKAIARGACGIFQ